MVQACYCVQKCKLHLLVGQGVLEEEVLHTGRREGRKRKEGGREGGRREGEGEGGEREGEREVEGEWRER